MSNEPENEEKGKAVYQTQISIAADKLLNLADSFSKIALDDEQSVYALDVATDCIKETLKLRRKMLELIDALR